MAAGSPFEVVEGLLERLEEKVFGTGGDAAAEDDELGIEDVDQGRNGGGEMADGGEPDFLGVFITSGISIEKSVRGSVAAFAAKADGLIADGVFEAAGRVEVIAGRIRVDAEMAEMTGAADFAGEEAAARVNRPTDASAEGEHEDIAAALGGSGPNFAEKGGVGVVEHAAIAFEEGRPVELFEAVHASRHPVDALAVRIGQTGCGKANGEFLACLRFELVDDLADGESETRAVVFEFAIAGRLRERGDGFRGLGVHERGFDVRAAEVDADGEVQSFRFQVGGALVRFDHCACLRSASFRTSSCSFKSFSAGA